ncbi:MAG: type II secretion system F family protein [Vulcanimicrobiota bacterium]
MIKKFSDMLERHCAPYMLSTELIVSMRQLVTLYQAGIPFSRALYVLSEQAAHPKLQSVFAECLRHINSGWTITHAFSIYPGLIPELYVKLIEVGEQTGNLDLMLEKVAVHAEKTREKSMKLYSALAYPTFIIVLCFAFLVIGPAYIFKGILDFLNGLNVALPITTRILIGISATVRSPVFIILVPILLVVVYSFIQSMWKMRKSRKYLQDLILAIPAVGRLYHTSEVASIARTMAIIYESGMLLLPGLELTKKTVSIVTLQDSLDTIREEIMNGDTLYEAFYKTGLYPPIMLQFLSAGEQTGDLGRMLNWAAWLCEQNVDNALTIVIEAIQPVVIFIIGIIVGFVVLATMSPMMKVAQGLM